ncbi:MAG: hypothetical protein AAGC68_03390 [Verrucomicrobiota bacterium]
MKTFESVDNHELEGEVYVVPTEFGGRGTAIHSGYRGQFFWHINHEDSTDWLAESYFENDLVDPGQSARIKIRLAGTIRELGPKTGMPSGRQFALREGSRIVKKGQVSNLQFQHGIPPHG